jgi:hypothetical protein
MVELLKILITGSLGGAVALFLLKTWITERVKNSIKNEYDRQLEVYKRELDKKQKIELVAELLAEWIKHPLGEPIPKDQRTRINTLSFKATLWLPEPLSIELNKRLQNRPDAKSIFEILLFAREQLVEKSSLTPEFVTYWGPELEQQSNIREHGENSKK